MVILASAVISTVTHAANAIAIDTVRFPSADGKTALTGYLFKPADGGPFPAVVMLHGRSGPYSSSARGNYSADSLSRRHREWGAFWAERGYLALLVDSFGPRGYAAGFPLHSYKNRPAEVSEQYVRPLDARGALEYLRARPDAIGERIGVQGWSNGAMAVLALLGTPPSADAPGFRAALAFYPGCRAQQNQRYSPYAPLLMLLAEDDEEVAASVCASLAQKLIAGAQDVNYVLYPGAQHAFDDPGAKKQSRPANHAATQDAKLRAERFFALHLKAHAR